MSNPAPTLNQINAFNATIGTTIDFNIIGGTEVIRSNKIYIYDLSDNSLICTHLYVSTESIHELPPNTSSSIVYASGKSSANFTNNTQYYAQIQTFTDTNGTQGASGLSIAKLFWCLPTPTLTLSTIPTTISTTSYNVSATYTPNTSGSATNEIQEFQFNLYSAIGALLQTSGVVLYGEGVDLSYNFSGLEVDSTYYVTLDVTTTQGMNVSAQSNTFTVSIDTPTMGSASVVNNGCDGYISVTSNLSSEYKHEESVDGGEIMSFTTESLNDIVKLVVDINPVQDLHGYDKPWVGGAGKNLWSTKAYGGLGYNTENGTEVSLTDKTATFDGNSIKYSISAWELTDFKTKALASGTYHVHFDATSISNPRISIYTVGSDNIIKDHANYTSSVVLDHNRTVDSGDYIIIAIGSNTAQDITVTNYQVESGSAFTSWTPYENLCPITGWTGCNVVVSPTEDAQDGTTYPVSWQTEAGTVYGGTVDVVTGVLTVTHLSVDMGTLNWSTYAPDTTWHSFYCSIPSDAKTVPNTSTLINALCSQYFITTFSSVSSWAGKDGALTQVDSPQRWIVRDTRYSDAATFKTAMSGVYLVYELATPQTYQLTPHQIQTLVGQNNLWSDTNGEMTIMYQLPITDLLVKRKDVSQVGSQWLTLHSVPITQASDMDFTYIDFMNQYGKTYQYALVPVLAQDQSGVVVQIEGGYTVSDNVNSIFDGVYIADQTNVERVKAGVGYGNVDMNQNVGTIVPIGSKYPIVITNSQNQYHNGSIRGKIVPNNFYSNGNLSRIDMVNKRDELERFLTNKRAKIIKDWNGKIWLVMILSNVACTFDDNYGMGMVEFSADWVEIGDPTTQQDLYNAGLINVGGV